MKTKKYFAVAMIVIVSLACSLFSSSGKSLDTTSADAQQTAISNDLHTGSATQFFAAQPCQVDKWEIVPTRYVSIPAHDKPDWVGTATPPNGWNIVIIFYAVHNLSDYWGKVTIDASALTIATEGGYTYGTVASVWFPSSEDVPLPVTQVQSQISPFGDGDMGKTTNQPFMWDTDYIPPTYGTKGYAQGYTSQYFGPAEGWANVPYYSILKVASTQKHLVLTMPDTAVDCFQGETGQKGTIPGKTFDLTNLKSDWTQYPNTGGVPTDDLGRSVNFPEIGTATLTDIQFGSGKATIKFQFTNSNPGEEMSGTLKGYIIGDDGITHPFFGGQFRVGPGATADGQDLVIEGGIPDSYRNMKLILAVDAKRGSNTYLYYNAFKFNP